MGNARGIGFAMFEFQSEYGTFPDSKTAIVVATNNRNAVVSGTSANDRFRQLIRSGIAQSEIMFYAETAFSRKPDNVFNTDREALKAGECGYGMVVKSDGMSFDSKMNPSCPLAVAPFTAAMDGRFDWDVYGGKAVILKMDNSVTSANIVKSTGKVFLNGKEFLETGTSTVWGTAVTPAFAFPIPE